MDTFCGYIQITPLMYDYVNTVVLIISAIEDFRTLIRPSICTL